MIKYTNRLLLILMLFIAIPTLAQVKNTDKPRKGEGIGSFLKRNGYTSKECREEFLRINERLFRKTNCLLLGVSYKLPSKGGDRKVKSFTKKYKIGSIRTEKLFGKKEKNVKVKSNKLEGGCFYIISGHGGPDPGAMGKRAGHDLCEDEYAYDVALRLAKAIMEEGGDIRLIIQDKKDGIRNDAYLKNSKSETCMGQSIPLNQLARLKQRCDKVNSLYVKDKKDYKYCRAIYIHVDSRNRGKRMDVFFYYPEGRNTSRRLAQVMVDKFESKYNKHQPGRGFSGTIETRGLYVMRNTLPECIFAELGNIRNSLDQQRFIVSGNRQAIANWLTEGFINAHKL